MKKQNKTKKLWFRAIYYGWGWYPCSWEGWLVLLVWVLLFVFIITKIDYGVLKNFIFILVYFIHLPKV